MWVVIGLGNPGKRYARTKHNFGFWVVDALAEKYNVNFRTGRGDYLLAKVPQRFVLVKPTTFMNNSGLAVVAVQQFFQIDSTELLVVYDDLDLPLGTVRFRPRGSSGGHRGVSSIIERLSHSDFLRLRLGIATDDHMRPAEKYVLKPFRGEDEERVAEVIQDACSGIEFLINHNITETMNRFNGKSLTPENREDSIS